MRQLIDSSVPVVHLRDTEHGFHWIPVPVKHRWKGTIRRGARAVGRGLAALIVALITVLALTSAPRAGTSWTQFYIGVGPDIDVILEDGVSSFADALNGGGIGGAVTVGADRQIAKHFVAGVFASYGLSDTGSEVSVGLDAFGVHLTSEAVRVEQDLTIGARGGVLVTRDTLLYALVGYSFLKLTDVVATVNGQEARLAQPRAREASFGAGFEQRLTPHVSVRSEYRFTSLGRATDIVAPGIVQTAPDKSIHSAQMTLSYRLGGASTHDGVDEESDAIAPDFAGLSVAAGVGLDATTHDIDANLVGLATVALDGVGGGNVSGAIEVGYDWLLSSNWLVGVLGRIEGAGQEQELIIPLADIDFAVNTLAVDQSWMVGARAGYVLSQRSLVYGLLGYSRVRFHDVAIASDFGRVNFALPAFEGISVGAGFEQQIYGGLVLRGEYVFTSLKRQSVATDFAPPELIDVALDPNLHAMKLAVAYRF